MWGVERNALGKCVFRNTSPLEAHRILIGAREPPIKMHAPVGGGAGLRKWPRPSSDCKERIGPRIEAQFVAIGPRMSTP